MSGNSTENTVQSTDPKESSSNEVDGDLSELLDSVLADFSKQPTPTQQPVEKPEIATPVPVNPASSTSGQEWSEDFIKQAAEQFENNIAALLGDTGDSNTTNSQFTSEQIQASFKQMAEAAQHALTNPGIEDPRTSEFAQTISQTIQGLSQDAENLQAPISEADIMNMFGNLGGGSEQGNDQNSFLPFMQGMMQGLLSKEVLYPSLQDIISKYPQWLEDNEGKLSEEDSQRYGKQLKLMREVCAELEKEKEDDDTETKKQRFDRVLSLMQTLQDYGTPPTDIVSESDAALPNMDQQLGGDQCVLM